MENDREARINIKDLANEEVDIDDI